MTSHTLTFSLEGNRLVCINPTTHVPFSVPLTVEGLQLIRNTLLVNDRRASKEFLAKQEAEMNAFKQAQQARMEEYAEHRRIEQARELEELF